MPDQTKILVADDERVVRHISQLSLERDGYEVSLAEDGLETFEQIRSDPGIEIALIDLKMPGMEGMELLRAIKRDYPHIEVLIMTGYATIEVAIQALKLGAYDFLLKPLKTEQIRLAVNKCRDKIKLSHENRVLKQANQKLRDLQIMKDKFVAIVSHELRTPVSHLKGYLSILNDTVFDELSHEEKQNCMKIIETAVTDLEHIVTDMIDTISLEKGLWRLCKEKLDLNQIVCQVIDEFKMPANFRGIRLKWAAPSQQCYVLADRRKTKVMVSELLQNAIKFTPDGGAVEISLSHDERFWILALKDSGVGIDPGEQGKIFEKFYEVQDTDYHSSSKSGFMGGGIGMGLALARAIAEAHDGGIKVDSSLNQGSTFQVLLPRENFDARVSEQSFSRVESESETLHHIADKAGVFQLD